MCQTTPMNLPILQRNITTKSCLLPSNLAASNIIWYVSVCINVPNWHKPKLMLEKATTTSRRYESIFNFKVNYILLLSLQYIFEIPNCSKKGDQSTLVCIKKQIYSCQIVSTYVWCGNASFYFIIFSSLFSSFSSIDLARLA